MLKNKKIKDIVIKLRSFCYFIPILLSLLNVYNVYSNLQNINDVYGLYDAVKDNFKHLSPFHGFILLEKNITRNFYEYGPGDDAIAILARDLFRLEGDTFKGTTRRNLIGNYLDSKIIGQILAVIETNHDKESLRAEFKKLIDAYIKGKSKLEEIRKAFGSTGKFNTEVGKFSDKLINALSAVGHFSKEDQVYPAHTVHYIILSFLYAKINEKADLKVYFDQLKTLNNNEEILKSAHFWQAAYDKNSQLTIIRDFKAEAQEKLWDYVVKNYESLGFAYIATEKFGGEYPPYLSYRTVLPEWFKDIGRRENYDYSDCMETALRNLLNFTFYVSGEIILPETIDKGSIGAKFYQEFTIGEISGQKAHDKWATITSNVPGVAYLRRSKRENGKIITEGLLDGATKPKEDNGWYYYELKPSLTNIWKVANHIFNLNLKGFGDFLKAFQLVCSKEIEETETQLQCKITDSNRRDCTLNIWPKHGEVAGFKTVKMVSLELQKIIRDKLFAKNFKNFDLVINLFGFALLKPNPIEGFPVTLPELKNKGQELLDSGYLRYILMTEFLADNKTKIHLLEFLLSEIQNKPKNDWYIAFVKLLVNYLLKLNDEHTTIDTLRKLAEYSKGDLIQWTMELIEELAKKITSYDIWNWIHRIERWRSAHVADWITDDWLGSLLEKANPYAFFRIFMVLPLSAFLKVNNLKELIAKNFSGSDLESNTRLLTSFLNYVARSVRFFGVDWVQNLIEVNKAKLDDAQKSVVLETIIQVQQMGNRFDADWMKSLILDIKQPSDSLKKFKYDVRDFLGDELWEQVRTNYENGEELEEEFED